MVIMDERANCSTRSATVTWCRLAENLAAMMWKSSPARNSVTTCRNLVEDSRGVRRVERNIWPRTLMLSSQWKKWCKQQKMVVVDYAEMKECASAVTAVWRDESRMAERVGNCIISSNMPVRSRRKICCWIDSRSKASIAADGSDGNWHAANLKLNILGPTVFNSSTLPKSLPKFATEWNIQDTFRKTEDTSTKHTIPQKKREKTG
jgi:hypothetical protein